MSTTEESQRGGLSPEEHREVEENAKPSAAVIYSIVRQDGDEELERGFPALWWSGVAAGLSIGFSVLSEAILSAHLPDAEWKPLVDNFGYCVGFLIVVLARQQLFTENTLTVVLPVLADLSVANVARLLRLWGIVFAANLVGCLGFAAFMAYAPVMSADVAEAFAGVSHHLMANSAPEMFFKGIVAGWLIATMVWMLPSAEGSAKFWIIVLATYLIAVADLTHVVAGSVEAFYLMLLGQAGVAEVFGQFMLPTLAGNMMGGTALFALLAYGQVREEID